jgi:hypothetical protein
VRPVPIPPELVNGRPTIVLGEADPTRDDVRPCEYLVTTSTVYGAGWPAYTAVLVLDDNDRAAIAAGARLTLTLDGGEVPWSINLLPVGADELPL